MDDLTLPGETRIAVAGDWHGSIVHTQHIIPWMHRLHPDIKTVVHVGDFGIPRTLANRKSYLSTASYWAVKTGIRLLVTPGNHEGWTLLDELFEASGGQPVEVEPMVWLLPRGYRFTIAGISFLSFGGAASIDYKFRVEGADWFPTEMPTEAHVAAAIAGGPVDVLITHETVNGGTPSVEKMLAENPQGWDADELAYSSWSRKLVTDVWDGVNPRVLAHGHMHKKDEITLDDGRRVYSMHMNSKRGNIGFLTLNETLDWEWLD